MRPKKFLPFLLLLLVCALAFGDQVSERQIAPGVYHRSVYRFSGPWAINVTQVDLSQPHLSLEAALVAGRVAAVGTLSSLAPRLDNGMKHPVAILNGDFFIRNSAFSGDPLGLQICDGELLSMPMSRSVLLIGPDGPRIEIIQAQGTVAHAGISFPLQELNQSRRPGKLALYTTSFGASTLTDTSGYEAVLEAKESLRSGVEYQAVVRSAGSGGNAALCPGTMVLSGNGPAAQFLSRLEPGDQVSLSISTVPPLQGITQALGGGPRLLREGRLSVEWERESFSRWLVDLRHPRTAIGFGGGKFYLVAVDGRRPGYSEGMTLLELAELMKELGCQEAMNLDGGGSTEMWIRGQVVNCPSDGCERPVANGLALMSSAPRGPLAKITIWPPTQKALVGGRLSMVVQGEDSAGNQVPLDATGIRWEVSPLEAGRVEQGAFLAERVGECTVRAVLGELSATATVSIAEPPKPPAPPSEKPAPSSQPEPEGPTEGR